MSSLFREIIVDEILLDFVDGDLCTSHIPIEIITCSTELSDNLWILLNSFCGTHSAIFLPHKISSHQGNVCFTCILNLVR